MCSRSWTGFRGAQTHTELKNRYVEDGLHRFVSAVVVERRLSGQQLKSQHSHSPNIDLFAVSLPRCHLRTRVVQGATAGLSLGLGADCPPKIAQLSHSLNKITLT